VGGYVNTFFKKYFNPELLLDGRPVTRVTKTQSASLIQTRAKPQLPQSSRPGQAGCRLLLPGPGKARGRSFCFGPF